MLVLRYCYRNIFTATGGDGERSGDGCTSGFMSVDRIRAVLNRGSSHLEPFYLNRQAIIPGINFTCDGNIRSWIFGARWQGGSAQDAASYTELQIWRSSGNGSYTKVGSTTIMIEQNRTEFYRYRLSSPLPFREGDILGYYQPSDSRRQFGLLFESEHGHREYYTRQDSGASHLTMSDLQTSSTPNRNLLISVETGKRNDGIKTSGGPIGVVTMQASTLIISITFTFVCLPACLSVRLSV